VSADGSSRWHSRQIGFHPAANDALNLMPGFELAYQNRACGFDKMVHGMSDSRVAVARRNRVHDSLMFGSCARNVMIRGEEQAETSAS
jgi:hypothetical protein